MNTNRTTETNRTTATWTVGENPEPQRLKSQVWNFPIPFNHTKNSFTVTVNGSRTNSFQYTMGVVSFERGALQDGDVVTIARYTELEAAEPTTDALPEYSPGDSIKAADLNEANALLLQRIEELETIVKTQTTDA